MGRHVGWVWRGPRVRLPVTQEVAGSSPVAPAILIGVGMKLWTLWNHAAMHVDIVDIKEFRPIGGVSAFRRRWDLFTRAAPRYDLAMIAGARGFETLSA
jgi:hypothetical protein